MKKVLSLYSKIFWERPHPHNYYYSILLWLFYHYCVNLLLCLIYKLNVIIDMFRKKQCVSYLMLSTVSGIHWGSWNAFSVDKEYLLYEIFGPSVFFWHSLSSVRGFRGPFFFFLSFFKGLHPWHKEVPGLGIKSNLAGLPHSHSNAGPELHLWPTLQHLARPDP